MATKFDKTRLTRLRNNSPLPIFQVVEGNYLLHRAFAVYPKFTNGSGIPTGAVAGSLEMFCSDYSALRPKYVAVSFDVPGHNFRHSIYEGYKYNDPLDPGQSELGLQLLIMVRLFQLLGVKVLFLQGIESDDTVGALATQADDICGEPVNVIIQSGDKDIAQFVSKRCKTVDTRGAGFIGTPRSVEEKFGIPPKLISDYLALVGDRNDGIPGLQGVGPDKAVQMLKEFGSVKGILKAKDKGKWAKYLTPSNLAGLRRDYSLTHIRTDINVAMYGPYHLHPCHPVYLQQALKSLGIRRLPSLVKAQLDKASLDSQDNLFDDAEKSSPIIETSKEWDGLMGDIWKHTKPAWQKARFKEEK